MASSPSFIQMLFYFPLQYANLHIIYNQTNLIDLNLSIYTMYYFRSVVIDIGSEMSVPLSFDRIF